MIEYFIEGIPDSRFNKSVLFQSNSIRELKENISVYEKIRVTSKYSNKSFDSKFSNVKTEKSLNEKTAVT